MLREDLELLGYRGFQADQAYPSHPLIREDRIHRGYPDFRAVLGDLTHPAVPYRPIVHSKTMAMPFMGKCLII